MKTYHAQANGFTLIELMVTIAIAAILMMVAVPSFTSFQRNAELTSRMNSLLASINTVRSEAMKRGRDAVILPLAGNWDNGMIAFVDMNNNLTYESGTDILIYKNDDPKPSYLTISGDNAPFASTPYIRFDAQGYSRPVAPDLRNFTISIARNDVTGSLVFSQTRRLKVSITGRPRICTPTSASDSTCLESTTAGE
jgi:type IV fimbrial biogenesis protein FimT